MFPSIDGAGVVLERDHPDWPPGDRFVHKGLGAGEADWGCMAPKARLNWLVPLPTVLTPHDAMAVGISGCIAMMCVMAFERQGVVLGDGEILVTGTTGGVISVAVARLARLGYAVVATTGTLDKVDYLASLGGRKGYRSGRVDRLEQAPTKGSLDGRYRWPGGRDAGDHLRAYPIRRCGCSVRSRGDRLSRNGHALHLPRRNSVRRGRCHGAHRASARGVEALAADLDPALPNAMTTDTDLDGVLKECRQLMQGCARNDCRADSLIPVRKRTSFTAEPLDNKEQ